MSTLEPYLILCLQKLGKSQPEINSIVWSLNNDHTPHIINNYIGMAHIKHFYYLLDKFEYDLLGNENINYKLEDFIIPTTTNYQIIKYMYGQQFLTSTGKMIEMVPIYLPTSFLTWGFEELKRHPIRITNIK